MSQHDRTGPQAHPLDLPATRIAAGIKSQEFSAEAIVGESLRRARILEEQLNPFTLISEERALGAAQFLDKYEDGALPVAAAG